MIRLIYTILLGAFCLSTFAQQGSKSYREKLNEWHYAHEDTYLAIDSVLKNQPKSKTSVVYKPGGDPATYEFVCQDMFLSGTNLAWGQFGGDVGYGANPNITYFNTMFAEIKAAGGNSMRWWLHTDASFTPEIETNGSCPGLSHNMTNEQIIGQMEAVLDAAYANGIMVDICLFSFDMLQDDANKGWSNIDLEGNYNFLTTPSNVDSYIENALTPMVNALKDHPALLCWEVFNEPEGMASEHGWTGNQGGLFVSMSDIQMVVNKIAGAIHRLDNKNPVTNGCWAFIALSDIAPGATQNYYRDDRLIAAGGDVDGTLDFYQVHYYSWAQTGLSPFHHDAGYWGLDKPIMVAEFHVEDTYGVAAEDLYDELYHRGYFGAWGWQYNESDLWSDIKTSMTPLYTEHPTYIDFDKTLKCAGAEDCAGVVDGRAYRDDCEVCVGGTTGLEPCTKDCNGEWGGTASIDNCGVCSGGTTAINPNSSCNCEIVVEDQLACLGDEVELSASGAVGTLAWYLEPTGGDPVATDAIFSPTVTSDTSYYVIDIGQGQSITSLGEEIQNSSATIWNVDDFETNDKKIAITVSEEVTIDAVYVYPQTAGTDITVNISDATQVVATGIVMGATTEKTRIPLTVTLAPGDYKIDAVGTSAPLEYQATLAAFPYQITGLISFTGTESWVLSEGRYGLFYDWEIVQEGGKPTCARKEIKVTIDTDCNVTGIATGNTSEKITLVPNPFNHQLKINSSANSKVEVVDLNGRLIFEGNNVNTIETSDFTDGLYIVRIIDESGVKTFKVEKAKF